MKIKYFISFLLIYTACIISVTAQDIRFVQISDTEYSKTGENQALAKTIKDINKLSNVDFVIFTGDNIKKPNPEDVKGFLKEAKKLKKPFYLVVGEKDVNKHKNISKKQYAKLARRHMSITKKGNINYIFEHEDVVFIVVDGARDVIPGSNGYFKEDTVEWLETQLALHKNKNIVILQHFPLIPPTDDENHITFKPEKYLEVLHNYKNVKAIISGHFGINKEINVDGITHITTAPAPTYRIIDIIDCKSENPTIWAEIRHAE